MRRAALLLLAACASAPAAPTPAAAPGPERVSLRFAWPEHLAAEVTSLRTGTVSAGGQVRSREPRTAVQTLEGTRTPDGVRVTERVAGLEGEVPASAPFEQQLLAAASRLALIVGSDASVVRVEGVDEARRMMLAAAQSLPEAARVLEIRSLTADPVLTLVVEPDTLVPHAYEKRTRLRVEMVIEGTPAVAEGEEIQTRMYRYAAGGE